MEIAIMAGFFAERNMNINTSHTIRNFFNLI
jgi:hypothetical protein